MLHRPDSLEKPRKQARNARSQSPRDPPIFSDFRLRRSDRFNGQCPRPRRRGVRAKASLLDYRGRDTAVQAAGASGVQRSVQPRKRRRCFAPVSLRSAEAGCRRTADRVSPSSAERGGRRRGFGSVEEGRKTSWPRTLPYGKGAGPVRFRSDLTASGYGRSVPGCRSRSNRATLGAPRLPTARRASRRFAARPVPPSSIAGSSRPRGSHQ